MILDFLRRFVGEAEQLGMSEEQAYIALPFFLKGQAKHHFEAVKDSTSEGEGGVTCWPEAVQYLLRSYATANTIRAAILALRDVRQQPSENEQTYSARLAKAEVRCGNIHSQDEKKTLFIDGLIPAIKAIVSRYRETHDGETYLELLQHAQAEGDSYRARAREGRRPAQPLVAGAKTPKPAAKAAPRKAARDHALFADPFDGLRDPLAAASQADGRDAMLFMSDRESDVLTSIPTTDLPSTEVDETEMEDDPVLAFGQRGQPRRNVPAPRIPYKGGTQPAAQRPGWDAPRSPTRSPARPQRAQVICHTCYDLDNPHYAPDCGVPFREKYRIVRNYERLSPEQKALVPADSYLRASARFTSDGRMITPASAVAGVRNAPPQSVEKHPVVLSRQRGEGPSAKN